MTDVVIEDLKITRKLYEKNNIVIKLNVPLQKENYKGDIKYFHNEYVNPENKKYITVDVDPFVTIEMKDTGGWDKKKSIIVTDNNIHILIKGFKQIIDNMINGGLYAQTQSGQLVIYKDKVKENTVTLNNMLGSQYVSFVPSIYYDEHDDIPYECCLMYFNKKEFYIPLTVDVLGSVYYKLKKIDIFTYSQALLNYYVLSKDKVIVPENEKRKPKKNVFKDDMVVESTVSSSMSGNKISTKSSEDFFGMKSVK